MAVRRALERPRENILYFERVSIGGIANFTSIVTEKRDKGLPISLMMVGRKTGNELKATLQQKNIKAVR